MIVHDDLSEFFSDDYFRVRRQSLRISILVAFDDDGAQFREKLNNSCTGRATNTFLFTACGRIDSNLRIAFPWRFQCFEPKSFISRCTTKMIESALPRFQEILMDRYLRSKLESRIIIRLRFCRNIWQPPLEPRLFFEWGMSERFSFLFLVHRDKQ